MTAVFCDRCNGWGEAGGCVRCNANRREYPSPWFCIPQGLEEPLATSSAALTRRPSNDLAIVYAYKAKAIRSLAVKAATWLWRGDLSESWRAPMVTTAGAIGYVGGLVFDSFGTAMVGAAIALPYVSRLLLAGLERAHKKITRLVADEIDELARKDEGK